MGDWGFLEKLLDHVQEHSTATGKVWLTVLFIFRTLILGLLGSPCGGMSSQTLCATPDSLGVSTSAMTGRSQSRMSATGFSSSFVSTPTLVYLGYVIYLSRWEEKLREQENELHALQSKDYKVTAALIIVEKMAKICIGEDGRIKIRGPLMWTYILSVLVKSIIEAGFLLGQWFLLYGIVMKARYICQGDPCPV